MKKVKYTVLMMSLLLIPLVSSEISLGIDDPNIPSVVFGEEDQTTFTNNTGGVNSSEFWDTNIGSLGDVNSTQFYNGGGTLSILESWVESLFSAGSSPWAFTSTTIYNDTTGVSVGIGTNSPGRKLEVNGSGILISEPGGESTILNNSGGNFNIDQFGTSNMSIILDNTGDGEIFVGIGRPNPSNRLSVNGSINVSRNVILPSSSDSQGQIVFGGTTVLWTPGSQNIFIGSGTSRAGNSIGGVQNTCIGGLACQSLSINATGNFGLGLRAMRFSQNATDNLCIGADSCLNLEGDSNVVLSQGGLPIQRDVDFNVIVGSQGCNILNTSSSGNVCIGRNAGADLVVADDNVFIGTGAGDHLPNPNISNSVGLGPNANPNANGVIILGGNGSQANKVGIGIPVPSHTLTIQGDANLSRGKTHGFYFINNSGNIGLGTDVPIAKVGVVGNASFTGGNFSVDTDSLFVNPDTNFVGMGTITPLTNLHVSGSSTEIRIQDTSPVNRPVLRFRNGDDNDVFIGYYGSQQGTVGLRNVFRIFISNSSSNVNFDTNGNVSIGLNSWNVPQKFVVVGSSNITGNLRVGGNINVTGCIEYNLAGTRTLLGTCV